MFPQISAMTPRIHQAGHPGYADHQNEGLPEQDSFLELMTLVDTKSFKTSLIDVDFPIDCPPTFTKDWIQRSSLYDKQLRQWRNIRSNVPFDTLVGAYRDIIEQFLSDLLPFTGGEYVTVAFDLPSHRGPVAYKKLPTLAICGIRDSFPYTHGRRKSDIESGKQFHASPIEIKFEKGLEESYEVMQLAVYSREYLRQQPTRHTVQCLLLTEYMAKTYVFDCNGLLVFDRIDVHAQPEDFLHCLIKLATCGTSVHHDFDNQFFQREGQRWIPTSFYPDPLRVCDNAPYYKSNEIFRRRTVCWKLQTEQGDMTMFVKNSSCYHDVDANMVLEGRLLEGLRDVRGVGRLYGHTEQEIGWPADRQWTPGMNLYPVSHPMQYNVRCSLAVEFYERSILDFNDRSELLHVLREAITTHKMVWIRGFWHDDIRPETIRMANRREYRPGRRAVLIGFSRAKFVDSLAGSDIKFTWDHGRDGKDTFKSRCRPRRLAPWLGYLHDLESFLLVLLAICVSFPQPHPTHARLFFPEWNDSDHKSSSTNKDFLLRRAKDIYSGFVLPYFGQIFAHLIGEWLHLLDEGFRPVYMGQPCAGGQSTIDLMEERYAAVLAMIDRALVRIERERN